jgi:hypothetical protein
VVTESEIEAIRKSGLWFRDAPRFVQPAIDAFGADHARPGLIEAGEPAHVHESRNREDEEDQWPG